VSEGKKEDRTGKGLFVQPKGPEEFETMKKLALGALMIGLLAACGGGSGDDDVTLPPDAASGPDASAECNPISNTGCDTGQKCTWIHITATLGRIGCVADGDKAIGTACTSGLAHVGETTGFDDCVGGNVCIGNVCEPVCTISPDSCATGKLCGQYQNLFANGTDAPTYGACDDICDPGPGTTLDNRVDCGSADLPAPRGCYGLFFPVQGAGNEFTCSPAGADANVHGVTPAQLSLNACAPGYVLYFDRSSDFASASGTIKCIATCVPGEVSQGNTANLQGLAGNTCGADRGVIEAGYECKYMHWHMNPEPTRDFNKNGICLKPANWAFSDIYNTPPTATCNGTTVPSCADIVAGSTGNWECNTTDTADDFNAQEQWGCKPLAPAFTSNAQRDAFRSRYLTPKTGAFQAPFLRDAR